MTNRIARILLVGAAVAASGSNAAAESYVSGGLGLTVVSEASRGAQTAPQGTFGGGVFLSPHFGVGVEVVTPATVSVEFTGGPRTVFSTSRDVIVSGVVRARVVSGLELLGGASYVLQHNGTSVLPNADTPGELTGGVLVGADFPGRLNRHIAIVPSARLHVVSRGISSWGSVLFLPAISIRLSF